MFNTRLPILTEVSIVTIVGWIIDRDANDDTTIIVLQLYKWLKTNVNIVTEEIKVSQYKITYIYIV